MTTSAAYLLSHRHLLLRTTRSELRSRYAGSLLGMLWAVLGPLSLLALYSTIYLFIFRVRVEGLSAAEYVFFVFSGLVPFFMTAESMTQGVGSVINNKAVLENTVFPIELAPPKALLLGQTPMLAGLPVVVVGSILIGNGHWTMLLVPVLWLLHLAALAGIIWCLSLLNVVFRDIQYLIGVVLMALLIASPFAYTPDMVPQNLQPIIVFNPFAYYVMAYQDLLILGRIPSLFNILFLIVFSIGMFLFGSWFFCRAKRVIIDYV